MRVATYTQSSVVTRGSLVAICILIATVLLGTSAVLQIFQFAMPALSVTVTFAWLALYLCAFLGLMLGQGINWISWLVRYRILLVLLLLGTIASISWALDTRLSLERTVHLVGSTVLAIYLGFTLPLLTTLRVLGVVLGIVLLASLAAVLAVPELGIESYEGSLVWRGVMSSKNALGFWASIGVLLYVSLGDSTQGNWKRLLCYLMAALSLALLVFSHSATSLLALILAGALSTYLYVANRFRLGFVQMSVLTALCIGLAVVAVLNIDTAELVGRSGDLTGRGEVWRQTWNLIMERPVTGYGYGVLWFPNGDSSWIQETYTDFTWTVHHAHNGFLQVASEIGLPLAVAALLMVVQQLIEIFYCQYQRQQVGVLFVLAFTMAYLISNFSEARFLVNRELFWILFIALPISMLRQINLVVSEDVETANRAQRADPGSGMGRDGRRGLGRARLDTAAHDAQRSSVDRIRPVTPAPIPPVRVAAGGLASTATSVPRAAGGQVIDAHEETMDDWSEIDFDATVEALTLADADIDLGPPAKEIDARGIKTRYIDTPDVDANDTLEVADASLDLDDEHGNDDVRDLAADFVHHDPFDPAQPKVDRFAADLNDEGESRAGAEAEPLDLDDISDVMRAVTDEQADDDERFDRAFDLMAGKWGGRTPRS